MILDTFICLWSRGGSVHEKFLSSASESALKAISDIMLEREAQCIDSCTCGVLRPGLYLLAIQDPLGGVR